MVVEILKGNSNSIILYTFYHPPNSGPEVLLSLNTSLLNTKESTNIILVGDFNLPSIDWSLDLPAPANNDGLLEDTLCNRIGDDFLQQHVAGPTHIGGNKLDLVLCNCPEIFKNVSASSPDLSTFPTDHYIIEFELQLKFPRAKPVRRKAYNFKRANFDELREYLSYVHHPLC